MSIGQWEPVSHLTVFCGGCGLTGHYYAERTKRRPRPTGTPWTTRTHQSIRSLWRGARSQGSTGAFRASRKRWTSCKHTWHFFCTELCWNPLHINLFRQIYVHGFLAGDVRTYSCGFHDVCITIMPLWNKSTWLDYKLYLISSITHWLLI